MKPIQEPVNGAAVARLQTPLVGLLLAIFWSAVVLGSYSWNRSQQSGQIEALAVTQARTAFEKDVQYRLWAAMHGGVYVPISEETPANPPLEGVVAERDITTPGGRKLTLVNPAYMTRQVHELGNQRNGALGHITSLKPIRTENRADAWETKALLRFEQGVREVADIEWIGDQEFLRYMRPLITQQACL